MVSLAVSVVLEGIVGKSVGITVVAATVGASVSRCIVGDLVGRFVGRPVIGKIVGHGETGDEGDRVGTVIGLGKSDG